MIIYNNTKWCGYAQYLSSYGSAIFNHRSLPQAIISAVITCVATHYKSDIHFRETVEYSSPTIYYSGISFVMSFLLVFRTNMAYNRYWEGRSHIQQMTSKLEDIGMHLKAFVLTDDAETNYWRERMARYLILYFALAVSALRVEVELDDIDEILRKTNITLEPKEYKQLNPDTSGSDKAHTCRNYVVAGWIAKAWTEKAKSGGVDAPPPVLTRTYQIISEAQLAFNSAQMIQTTPFPYPLMQVCSLMLHIHMLASPLVISLYVSNGMWSTLNSFLSTLVLFALNCVSEELEDPFGMDPNDLPLNHYLTTFIQHLWAQGLGSSTTKTNKWKNATNKLANARKLMLSKSLSPQTAAAEIERQKLEGGPQAVDTPDPEIMEFVNGAASEPWNGESKESHRLNPIIEESWNEEFEESGSPKTSIEESQKSWHGEWSKAASSPTLLSVDDRIRRPQNDSAIKTRLQDHHIDVLTQNLAGPGPEPEQIEVLGQHSDQHPIINDAHCSSWDSAASLNEVVPSPKLLPLDQRLPWRTVTDAMSALSGGMEGRGSFFLKLRFGKQRGSFRRGSGIGRGSVEGEIPYGQELQWLKNQNITSVHLT